MPRHWIIRSFFIALCILSLTAWAWSYRFAEAITHDTGKGTAWQATLAHGNLLLIYLDTSWFGRPTSTSYQHFDAPLTKALADWANDYLRFAISGFPILRQLPPCSLDRYIQIPSGSPPP